MSWDYSEFSKAAKLNGGPEAYVEKLVASGRQQMMPAVGIAAAGGIAITLGAQKFFSYVAEKHKEAQAELEEAKAELIAGIKKYDASHSNTDDLGDTPQAIVSD